jgi:hypothetical protein
VCACVCFWLGVCITTSIAFIISAGLPLLGIDSVVNFWLS